MADVKRQISGVSTAAGDRVTVAPELPVAPKGVGEEATKVINILRTWECETPGQFAEKDVAMAVDNVLNAARVRSVRRWRVCAILSSLLAGALLIGLVVVCQSKNHRHFRPSMRQERPLNFNQRGMWPYPGQEHLPYSEAGPYAGPAVADGTDPSAAAAPFVPVEALNHVPLETISMMDTLSLQLGTKESGKQQEYRYHVDGVFRESPEGKTVVMLGGGHTLTVTETEGVLADQNGNLIKVLHFTESPEDNTPLVEELASEEQTNGDQAGTAQDLPVIPANVSQARTGSTDEKTSRDDLGLFEIPAEVRPSQAADIPEDSEKSDVVRRLGPKHRDGIFAKPVNVDPEMPTSFFDAYCKYGCGGMAVTFPYYYRPFFGYGFPLVGTEAMFPAGYGGYAAAPLLASQGGTPPMAGMGGPVVAGGGQRPPPGMGAGRVAGGVQPGTIPGY